MPWREWLGGCGSTMGNKQADMASAVAALHCVHTEFRVANQPVEVWLVEGRTRVTATSNVTAGELMLPPCNPHKMYLYETSVHPFAAEITMSVMKSTEKLLEPSQKQKKKQRNLNQISRYPRERRHSSCTQNGRRQKRRHQRNAKARPQSRTQGRRQKRRNQRNAKARPQLRTQRNRAGASSWMHMIHGCGRRTRPCTHSGLCGD